MKATLVPTAIVLCVSGLSGCPENSVGGSNKDAGEIGGRDSDSDSAGDSGSDFDSDSAGDLDSDSAGDSGSDDSAVTVNSSNVCPHVLLGSDIPITYVGNTEGLPNWAESARLEWQEAPEDSLLFIAPEDGDYLITMTSEAEVGGIWPSIEDYETDRYYTETDCPAEGTTATLDGVFTTGNADYPETFTAGQHVLIWVSSCYWEPVQSGPYTLTIEKI